MLVLKEGGKAELVVKRSRFISELMPVSDYEDAKETLRACKEAWALQGINHLVHAFITGPGANIMGCSDDGEPSGTAGRPVLEVLKGSGMTNVMLTVARYFGGIKLGTGGLVKAYTEAAQAAVAASVPMELVPMVSFSVKCPYQSYERIKLALLSFGAEVTGEEFAEHVIVQATMKEQHFQAVADQCRDISRGQAEVSVR